MEEERVGILVALLVIVSVVPYLFSPNTTLGVQYASAEDVEVVVVEEAWSWWGDRGHEDGKAQIRLKNMGDEPALVRVQFTPEDRFDIVHLSKTKQTVIQPGYTKVLTVEWNDSRHNQRNWERMHYRVEVCETKTITGVSDCTTIEEYS